MKNNERAIYFGYVMEIPAQYEVTPNNKLANLIRRLRDKISHRTTTIKVGVPVIFSKTITNEDIQILLSYLLNEFLTVSKKNHKKITIEDIAFELNDVFARLGLEFAKKEEKIDSYYYYTNSKSEKNKEYLENFKSWYNPKVDKSYADPVLYKLDIILQEKIKNGQFKIDYRKTKSTWLSFFVLLNYWNILQVINKYFLIFCCVE